jgi:hypothetical protein
MKRRNFLLAVGALATLPLIPRVARDAWNTVTTAYPPEGSLSDAQISLVSAVADTILPRTDTPGATDVGVPAWINVIVAQHFTNAERTVFIGGLDAINSLAMDTNGELLTLSSPERRKRVIAILDRPSAYERFVMRISRSRRLARAMTHLGDPGIFEQMMIAPAQRARAYKQLKELVVHGYFTSEHVHEEILMAHIMPGHFDGGVLMQKTLHGHGA